MKTILITGCNRGLGLGLVKELLKTSVPPQKLIATCRDVQKAEELNTIASQNKNVHIVKLDVTQYETYANFAKEVEEIVKDDGLNVLFNNAGYSPKSTRINMVSTEQLMTTLNINTVAPIMLTKALLPLIKKAAQLNAKLSMGASKAAIINMSSVLASIELNKDGGLYPYRCSKAALNMATKSLSVDLRNDEILVTCLHPGWVKTDMGGPNAPMKIESSTSSMVQFLLGLDESHHGKFYQYNGKALPW